MVPLKKILLAVAAALLPATAFCFNGPGTTQEAQARDEEARGEILEAYKDYNWALSNISSELKYVNEPTTSDYKAHMAELSKKIDELSKKVAEIDRADAHKLEQRGDFAGAEQDLMGVMKESKDDPQYYFELSQALYATGDLTDALGYSTKAIDLKPDFAEAYALRGVVKLREVRIYDALYLEDRGGFSMFEGGVVLGGPPYKKVPNVNLDGALDDLTRAVTLKPGFAEAWDARGLVRYFKGDPKGAMEDFSAAIKAKGDYATAWCNRAHIELFSGDTKDATADYEKAVALDPKLAAAWAGRAAAKQSAGDLDGALADSSQAIMLKGDYRACFLFRGILQQVKGDADSADAYFKKAGEMAPMVWMSNFNISYSDPALVKQSAIDIDSALAALDDPPAVPAGDAKLKAAFARAYLAIGGKSQGGMDIWRGRVADLDKAIALDPGLAEAYRERGLLRGVTYMVHDGTQPGDKLDDQTDALRDMDRDPALEKSSLEEKEKRDAALSIADLEKASQLGIKDDVESLTRLAGLKAWQTGDSAGALADIGKAIALAPDKAPGKADLYRQRAAIEKASGDDKASQADIMHGLDLAVAQSAGSIVIADAYYDRGREKEARKDYEGALADFSSAIDAGPAHAFAYAARAEINYRMGKMDTVMADLNKSITLDPDTTRNASAYYLRAVIEQNEHKPEAKSPGTP
ncbi:MAG TPA: tetratricopeptide repeat protein [Chthoniobacteraceae bacterium]|nr:tetratricopeptide repeat protein [Chthoniobacteraceae bacterium]